jgi:hypothetical protein
MPTDRSALLNKAFINRSIKFQGHRVHLLAIGQRLAPFCPIRRNTMISKSKLGALALVTVMGIVTPAFAQNLETGTAANTYGWNSPQADAISGSSSGLHAFGMVPRAHVRRGLRAFDMVPGAALGSDSPSATGGGSVGYNSHNETDY